MASHQDDDLKDVPPGRAAGAVLYVVCLAIFLAGFYLMAIAFDTGSPLLFTAGLLAAGGAWFLPLGLAGRPD
jgi:hypothetical protein